MQDNRRDSKEYHKRWYLLNRERLKAQSRKYQEEHRERYRLLCKQNNERTRMMLISLLGGKCVICSTTGELEIDHINGNGNKDRLDKGGSVPLYYYYLKHPEEATRALQVLCRKDNMEKRDRNHENLGRGCLYYKIKVGLRCLFN